MKLKSLAGFAVAAIIAACGGQVNKPAPPDMTPKHEGAGGAPAATEAETGGLLLPPGGSPNLNGAGGIMEVCGGNFQRASRRPTSMYLVIDQSAAMKATVPGSNPPISYWEAVQRAVAAFVGDPSIVDTDPISAIAVGVQFFPLDGVAPESCKADYATPEVEVGPLPNNAPDVTRAVMAHGPTSSSPIAPALRGAIAHMKSLAEMHPVGAAVVVLVTGSLPDECDPVDIPAVAGIAKDALETAPSVQTFVVGLNLGSAGRALTSITDAGSTGAPALIDGGDVVAQLVDALQSVRKTRFPCRFDLPIPPEGKKLDVSGVALVFEPDSTLQQTVIPRLRGGDDCALNGDKGWYYDNPTSPAKIETCFGTCSDLPKGGLMIASGCAMATPTL